MLSHATYSIKTNLGESAASYSNSPATPIYGTGQGSASSPKYWLLISNIIIQAHESCANGAVYASPDCSKMTKLALVAFVDNVLGRINAFRSPSNPDLQDLIALMQHNAQLWNDLLWSTGGALELANCQTHLIWCNFCSDGTPLLHTYDSSNPESPMWFFRVQ